MDKRSWLKAAAGLSFAMAAGQTAISVSPALAAYFQAPPSLLDNRLRLFLLGGAAALVLVVIGLYALSGAGSIRHLPLLRLGLIGVSSLLLLRGSFIVLTALRLLGIVEGEILMRAVASHLVFLGAGTVFAVGTALNWKEMAARR
jgi:hypothetical protein